FAGEFRSKYDTLDVLVNNAGVMATPFKLTNDGFEMQFGTNHLGHFLLTGLLLSTLMETAGSRVVTVTSIAHFNGIINFDDINSTKDYSRMKAYRQSKLANLLFTYELDRKLKQAKNGTISVAVHPGISSTNLVQLSPFLKRLEDMLLMTPAKGALPTVTGVADQGLSGGEYIGPAGFRQAYGFPALLLSGRNSCDEAISGRLWSLSEEMTGFKYNFKID
ncbi:MAG: SDR family NAD(P)-dependent oxidoreductase, partial [Bacteroidales bacterium]|nr:SDR family NAD(P)-dependent oxidoreductase [Bacteroidales bacterium]